MTQHKLDKKQLDQYKKILLDLKENFVRDIKKIANNNPTLENGDAGDISRHVLHMADVASDMYDREFNMGLASSEREVLIKIEQALKRIEDKSFGLCVECKKPIASARLKAIPYVDTCLKCQERLETRR